MSGPRRITRRTALITAAAGGTAALLRRTGVAAARRDGRVFSLAIGSFDGQSAPIATGQSFVLAGVQWSGLANTTIELRAKPRGGRWSPWATASVLGHDADGEAHASNFGEPVWTGAADLVQLRATPAASGVVMHLIAARHTATALPAAFPLAQPVLDAGPGQPPIIGRAAWAQGRVAPTVAPRYGTVKLAFVHHTENPNGYAAGDVPAMLLAIHDYHRYVRGWHDIGYNFVVDAFGRIWEARQGGIDRAVIGAQAGGYNQVSTGVAVMGSFVAVVPSPAAIAALERLLAWKLSLHGVPATGRVMVEVGRSDAFYTPFSPGAHVSLPRVAGHRDGDSTDCPGDAFYARLPTVRSRVRSLAGRPAALTVTPPVAAATAGVPLLIPGRLKLVSGSPLVGEPVELQELRAAGLATISQVQTAADGSWQAPVTLAYNSRLRALHRPRPAAVSDLIFLAVAPRITLALDSTAPLRISGGVSPSKRTVVVEMRQRGRVVARRQLRTANGRFATQLPARPGRYELIARTGADARNAAGASQAIEVTL